MKLVVRNNFHSGIAHYVNSYYRIELWLEFTNQEIDENSALPPGGILVSEFNGHDEFRPLAGVICQAVEKFYDLSKEKIIAPKSSICNPNQE